VLEEVLADEDDDGGFEGVVVWACAVAASSKAVLINSALLLKNFTASLLSCLQESPFSHTATPTGIPVTTLPRVSEYLRSKRQVTIAVFRSDGEACA